MPFQEIARHSLIVGYLQNIVRGEQPAHAYLFHGPSGVGKETLARRFAMALLCNQLTEDGDACEKCDSCRRFLRDEHPNFTLMEPEGQLGYKIEQLRDFIRNTNFMISYRGNQRVYLIPDAERMNPESANALLKTLEEPSDGVIMILVSSNILQLLPTIVSRCQSVKFSRLSREITENILVQKFKVNSETAKLAANLSDGSLGMAKMLSDDSFMKSRQNLYTLLAEHQPSDSKNIFTLVEQADVPTDTELLIFYNWVLFWLRDIVVYRITKDENLIINSDFRSQITNISSKWSWTAIRSAIQRLEYLNFVMREKFINSPFTLETVLLRAWQTTS